jgi:hypothetical protein
MTLLNGFIDFYPTPHIPPQPASQWFPLLGYRPKVHWANQKNQVVHNPGAIPDSRYLATADSTVVFEAAYSTFQEREGAKLFSNIADSNRTQLCAIVHSVPESVEGKHLRGLVKQVRKVAEEVYITHLSTDYYSSFGAKWTEFVDLMAA